MFPSVLLFTNEQAPESQDSKREREGEGEIERAPQREETLKKERTRVKLKGTEPFLKQQSGGLEFKPLISVI